LLAVPGEPGAWSAVALVALACLCWGLDNNLTALIDSVTPARTTFVKGLVAGAVNLAAGAVIEDMRPGWTLVGLALVTGALSYGVSIALYIFGAQRLGAARSQMLFSSSPFLGLALSWIALGEPVEGAQLAAGAIMAAGIALMLTARHVHAHRHGALVHSHAHRHDDAHHAHVHPGLPPETWHSHPHEHEPIEHVHPHDPDLHHRHGH
jgi:drug/metabolite transporter (DMT)-like permease